MPQLKVNDSVESIALQLIIKHGQIDVEIIKDENLCYEDTQEKELIPILISLNKLSKYNFIDSQSSKSIEEWINTGLRSVKSKQLDSFLKDLNELLGLHTYIVGNNLSAADVVIFVALHSTLASFTDKQKQTKFPNISKWFDLIQQELKPSNLLPTTQDNQDNEHEQKQGKKDKKKK